MSTAYYIRLAKGRESLNLLLEGSPETNGSLLYLFQQFGDDSGHLSYYDPVECCIVVLRSREVTGIRVYQYDDEAPYDGIYLDGRFSESWEG